MVYVYIGGAKVQNVCTFHTMELSSTIKLQPDKSATGIRENKNNRITPSPELFCRYIVTIDFKIYSYMRYLELEPELMTVGKSF